MLKRLFWSNKQMQHSTTTQLLNKVESWSVHF